MEHHDAGYPSPAPAMDIALWCGIPDLQQAFLTLLQQRGWRHTPDAPLLAILDAPFGYALRTLPATALAHRQVVVVTHNPCPEYWDDLWEFRPAILLASQCQLPALERALIDAAAGRRARLTPPHASSLTPAERAVLRAIAHGRTNQTDRAGPAPVGAPHRQPGDGGVPQTAAAGAQCSHPVLLGTVETAGCAARGIHLTAYGGTCRRPAPFAAASRHALNAPSLSARDPGGCQHGPRQRHSNWLGNVGNLFTCGRAWRAVY